MNIIISGGTGLIGHLLIPALVEAGNNISVLGRSKKKIKEAFADSVHAVSWEELDTLKPDEFDVIINLAGENIGDHRWSDKIKKKLLSSRVKTTTQLVNWGLNAQVNKPHLYNASAVGVYGLQKKITEDIMCREDSAPIKSSQLSFSTHLVTQWEEAAQKGAGKGMPVTLMRFGVVLKRGGGMLKKLALPAQWGLGAVVGSGEQPLAWIDSTDLVRAILFLIQHPDITGPVNLVAPECITQNTFTQTLAQVLKKPAFLRLPAFLVHLLFGEMGEELLLSGQAVVPQRLLEHSFQFEYATLVSALNKEFK